MKLRAAGSVLIALILDVAIAHASCPDQRASCLLHEEGVALLIDGKFSDAAQKFLAGIAAEPTARSYLGYAQAVEGLGQRALAFDTMLVAQKFSAAEVTASGGRDVDVNARAERIKYKLGELRSKIAFVWLRVPDGVAAVRVVAVQRQGEGDLPSPFGRWITVTPGQRLTAALDDGTRLEIPAAVTAGSQQVVVIPIPQSAERPPEARPPGQSSAPLYVPQGKQFTASPAAPASAPPAVPLAVQFATPAGQPVSTIGIEFVMLLPNVGNVNSGYGFGGVYERYVNDHVGISVRTDLAFHPENQFELPERKFSAFEVLVAMGLRSTTRRAYYGSFEAGATYFSQHSEASTPLGSTTEDYEQTYPMIIFGGGLRLGKVHVQASLVQTISSDANLDIPLRFMLTLGFDSTRR